MSPSLKKAIGILRRARTTDRETGIMCAAAVPTDTGFMLELYIDRLSDVQAAQLADRMLAQVLKSLQGTPASTEIAARIRSIVAARAALGIADRWVADAPEQPRQEGSLH